MDNELDEFMKYSYGEDAKKTFLHLKEVAKIDETMLNLYKVIKKQRKQSKKSRVKRAQQIGLTIFKNFQHFFKETESDISKRDAEFLKYVVYGECKVVL